MKNLFLIALILTSLFSKASTKMMVDDPCASITFPYTLTGANNAELLANLRQAILCANTNGNSITDVIDLNGHNLSAESSYDNSISGSFPTIQSKIELRNGTINRTSTETFRFFHISAGNELTLNNVELSNGYGSSTSADGGAIYNSGGSLNIYNSKLLGNEGQYGGAIFNGTGANLTIINSMLSGNKAQSTGGAIRNRGNTNLTNVTFAGNFATTLGGAVANAGTYSLTLNNCLVFSNEAGNSANIDGSYTNNSSLVGTDPSFVNALDASSTAPTTGGNYSLNAGSAAINAGNSALINVINFPKDLAGLQRISGTSVDIGAYEFPLETLPVNLTSFSLKKESNYITLNWSTSSEVDNDRYIVLRAGDEKDFHQIGEIKAKSSPDGKNTYLFYDRSPILGNNYYILRQIDKDGKKNDLGEKVVAFTLEPSFSLLPNPTIDKVTAYFKKGDYKTLILLNNIGSKIEEISLSPSLQQATLNLTNLPNGIYFIRLIGLKNNATKKVIKK